MEGLSTLPKNAENRDEEDIVLDLMQKSHHLYYDDLETWTWSMASTAHDGTSVNAIDFIRSGADNAPIVTPYKGKVVYNQRDSQGNPTLILEHKITTGGRTVYWYTKYLHMHVNADGKVYSLDGSTNQIVLMPGMELNAGASIGLTGSEGQSSGPHLHQELLIALNGKQIVQSFEGEHKAEFFTTKAVDQRLLLTTGERQVQVKAAAGYMNGNDFIDRGRGRVIVVWDDKIDAWVDRVNQVVYDRREQENVVAGTGTHWLAYETGVPLSQMKEVTFASLSPDGMLINKWLQSNNPSLIWDPSRREFIPR
jgi:hypothetical protein